MAEVKHGGCYDCGTLECEILKSVVATRTETNPRTGKTTTDTKSIALCDACLAREQAGKKG
jgi:hypothetical protein